jgi:hypothetical protein
MERLDPTKALCVFSLHGRCSSRDCSDLHLGELDAGADSGQVLDDLVAHFSSRHEPAAYVTPDMLGKAIAAATVVARQALIQGGVDAEGCLRTFVQSLTPMCRPKTTTR